ncbi:hypothetical protein ACA29_09250 [Lederbergia galactosidilytica]|uniref:Uncharacterized protein n=1 Tax=Lederbergia galactosidilytica TaxID=217031 RepID=A0A0Q9Y7I1_9BACI|nr:hypothetical protein ACA29_09250 [Lederbergia galactosidilytica]
MQNGENYIWKRVSNNNWVERKYCIGEERLYKHVEKEGTPLNGHVWMERTYEEWREDFPFWSIATIKRIFTSLKKQGLT